MRGASKKEIKEMKKSRVEIAAARTHLLTTNIKTKHIKVIKRNIALRNCRCQNSIILAFDLIMKIVPIRDTSGDFGHIIPIFYIST